MSSNDESSSEPSNNSLYLNEEENNKKYELNFPSKSKSKPKKIAKISKKQKLLAKKAKYSQKSKENILPPVYQTSEASANFAKNAKEHYLYKPYYSLPDLSPFVGELIEVRIASEYLSQNNKAFIEKRLWGSDIYTSDSDMVCVLQHSGFYQIKELVPSEKEGVSLLLRVSKCRSTYNSSYKNGIKSKKISNYQGHSIKPEGLCELGFLGEMNELKEMAAKMPRESEYERKKITPVKLMSSLYYTEYNMIFNLNSEMWLAYSLSAICDKGKEPKDFTSKMLQNQVLYLETEDKRYEISLNEQDKETDKYLFEEFEKFDFAEIKDPFLIDSDFRESNKIPLDKQYVKVIFSRIDWHCFVWGENCVKVNDLLITGLKCFNFFNKTAE